MYDLKNLCKIRHLQANAYEAMNEFVALDKTALAGGGIPAKYKEY